MDIKVEEKFVLEMNKNDFFSMKIGSKCEGGYFGGIINNNEERYAIIVSPKDLGETKLQFKTTNTADSGIQSTWNGQANTFNLNDDEHPAAQWCSNLNINGYTDWYLPAKDELNLIYNNLKKDFIKDFIRDFYWTSTEHTTATTYAWLQSFGSGYQGTSSKDGSNSVRAIRKVSL
jgi:hypothetical protein